MKSTRRTQPYRKGARQPGATLTAMRRGRSLYGTNPMDNHRRILKWRKRGALSRAYSKRTRG